MSTKEFFAELWAGSPGPMVCARCISVLGFVTLSVMGKISVSRAAAGFSNPGGLAVMWWA